MARFKQVPMPSGRFDRKRRHSPHSSNHSELPASKRQRHATMAGSLVESPQREMKAQGRPYNEERRSEEPDKQDEDDELEGNDGVDDTNEDDGDDDTDEDGEDNGEDTDADEDGEDNDTDEQDEQV